MSAERDMTAGMGTAITERSVKPILIMEGEFSTGFARYWTGYGTLTWNGYLWVGLGYLVAVSDISEGVEISAKSFTVDLNGQATENIALALSAAASSQGKTGRLWLGLLDASGAVIADPILLRSGRLDVARGTEAGETATITVTYEDNLVDLERPMDYRYTTESQRLFYPEDLGFEFVPGLQDAVDVWKE